MYIPAKVRGNKLVTPRTQVVFYCPDWLRAEIEFLAEENNRSLSSEITYQLIQVHRSRKGLGHG